MQFTSIGDHPFFQQALGFYNEVLHTYEHQPEDQEKTDPVLFQSIQQSYLTAQHALIAVIDAYVADQHRPHQD